MHITKYVAQVAAWHTDACAVLESFGQRYMGRRKLKRPALQFMLLQSGSHMMGNYRPAEHLCRYYIPVIIVLEDEYHETVVHECCHAYQRQIHPASDWHGDFFVFLHEKVCGIEHTETNFAYDVRKKVQNLNKVLHLHRLQSPLREVLNGHKYDGHTAAYKSSNGVL